MTITTQPAAQAADQPLHDLNASDIMTSDIASVLTTTTVGEAMRLMRTLNIRHLPVLGDGRFVGIVDDRLVSFALLTAGGFGEALEQRVSTAMTHHVPQVGPGEPLQRVAHLLRTSRCDAVVVIDARDHLLGIITMVDVVSAVALGSATPSPMDLDRWPPVAAVPAVDHLATTGARS